MSRNYCSRAVFRCFKTLERWGDKITGAAGRYFVGLAAILLTTGTICFFDAIMPNLSLPIISLPACMLIALNLHMHYFYVCTIPPGFVEDPLPEAGTSILWAKKKKQSSPARVADGGVRWSSSLNITKASTTQCSKCGQTRPERAHHCRICNRCVLKYDHHCPTCHFLHKGINQCVGLHNERHFVLFMAYLVLSTFCFCTLGYPQLFDALGVTYNQWPYHIPEIIFVLIYILSAVLCLAVGIMLSYHLLGISSAETSVESQDHDLYRKRAKSRGETFVNSYDLGRKRNLSLFFHIGESGYSMYTLIFPLRLKPYTDGHSWARKDGYERHHGLRKGEELTDESDDDD